MATLTGPTQLVARAPAPDLARGAMLLLIAVANVHLYLYGHPLGVRGYPAEQSGVDSAVALLLATLVDGRAYPMFGVLFGYGLVQLLRRHGTGPGAGSALIRRRSGWLILIGFGHGLLLFSGDIIGAYGLLGLLLAGLVVRGRDRRLLGLGAALLLATAVVGAVMAGPQPPGQQATFPSMTMGSPLPAAGFRVIEWVGIGVLMQALGVAAAVAFGVWAGRQRLLEKPDAHRALLGRVAGLGLGIAVLGGLPLALMSATIWASPSIGTRLFAGALHAVSGYGGGLGYAALAGLVVAGLGRQRGLVSTALQACGQRSMTCYLAQSVVFVAVLASYGGGLGVRIGVAGASLLAAAAWAGTVVAADLMRRAGFRGPAEVLMRRLTYGRGPASGARGSSRHPRQPRDRGTRATETATDAAWRRRYCGPLCLPLIARDAVRAVPAALWFVSVTSARALADLRARRGINDVRRVVGGCSISGPGAPRSA